MTIQRLTIDAFRTMSLCLLVWCAGSVSLRADEKAASKSESSPEKSANSVRVKYMKPATGDDSWVGLPEWMTRP